MRKIMQGKRRYAHRFPVGQNPSKATRFCQQLRNSTPVPEAVSLYGDCSCDIIEYIPKVMVTTPNKV